MIVKGRWCIQNDLLHELLTYGDGGGSLLNLQANWSIGSGFGAVKGILTWLVKRSLQIDRLPWMADTPFTFIPSNVNLTSALNYLQQNPSMVDAACAEIQDMYKFTQSFLSAKGYSKTNLVPLGRAYKNYARGEREFGDYATTMLRQAEAAKHLGISHINVPHDTITSWGNYAGYTGCVAGVEMGIAMENILCGADTLAPRANASGQFAMERGEWLVLNRRLDGLMELPVASINPLYGFQTPPVKPSEAKKVFDAGIPVVRVDVHLDAKLLSQPQIKQSVKARAKIAWSVFKRKHH